MKQFKAEAVKDEAGVPTGPMDLVNVNDTTERYFANDEDFSDGDLVTENEVFFQDAAYVDEQGTGNALFAFRKDKS